MGTKHKVRNFAAVINVADSIETPGNPNLSAIMLGINDLPQSRSYKLMSNIGANGVSVEKTCGNDSLDVGSGVRDSLNHCGLVPMTHPSVFLLRLATIYFPLPLLCSKDYKLLTKRQSIH